MRPVVLAVGKSASGWSSAAVDDYAKRLRRWDGLDLAHVKPERFHGQIDAVRDAEAGRLLGRIKPRDVVVAMDERGQAWTTEAFADFLQQHRLDGVPRVVFTIGGAYGHGAQVRARANHTLRLSTMVLNHEIARLVLVEQIYRAYAILNGVPYHH